MFQNSSPSDDDVVLLQAQVLSYCNEDYQCEKRRRKDLQISQQRVVKRIEKYKNKEKSEKYLANELTQRQKTYSDDLDRCLKRNVLLDNGVNLLICPCQLKHPLFSILLDLREQNEKGNLPYSCSYLEHPAQLIELIKLVHNLIEKENLKAQEKELEKQKGK